VFVDVEPMVMHTLDGGNVAIIAYGQTGSGKTHTMLGTDENPGVNRRAVKALLETCNATEGKTYALSVSLVEIYIDRVSDLLSDVPVEKQKSRAIVTHPVTKATTVSNLTERPVASVEDVVSALADGERVRKVADTSMNSSSSRSHLIVVVKVTSTDDMSGRTRTGKLTLVDLAGSERCYKSGVNGTHLTEANAINKSLASLGQVFQSIRSKAKHVPYRNSKLTHLLQDSLGGRGLACLFVTLSPSKDNVQETLGTLAFGMTVRSTSKGPAAEMKREDVEEAGNQQRRSGSSTGGGAAAAAAAAEAGGGCSGGAAIAAADL